METGFWEVVPKNKYLTEDDLLCILIMKFSSQFRVQNKSWILPNFLSFKNHVSSENSKQITKKIKGKISWTLLNVKWLDYDYANQKKIHQKQELLM